MKRLISVLALMAISISAVAQFRITTPNIELILKADPGSQLRVQYFGGLLSDVDFANLQSAGVPDHDAYPAYGFDVHKGYGTKAHYEALRTYGHCAIHRLSFLKKFYGEK